MMTQSMFREALMQKKKQVWLFPRQKTNSLNYKNILDSKFVSLKGKFMI